MIEGLKLFYLLSMLWALMVGYWSNLSSCNIMSYLVFYSTWYWVPSDGMFMIELFWVSTYPLEVLPLVCDCLHYSRFQWPFHPNLGLLFLTSLMRFVSQGYYSNMFIRSRTILPRIFKSLSFCLIGFWKLWFFNYPLNFTLPIFTLNLMVWHWKNGMRCWVSI